MPAFAGLWPVCLLLSALIFGFLTPAISAAQVSESFPANTLIGDGSKGRVWRQWVQKISERPVRSVSVKLRRQAGTDNTYVNLRFGKSGTTFENGKRVYLRNDSSQTVTWNVGGQSPRGKPLILNAYKGVVFVESAIVSYDVPVHALSSSEPKSGSKALSPRPAPHAAPFQDLNDKQQEMLSRCERRFNVQAPRIRIGRVYKTGGFFSGRYKVEGSVEGACIQEAGYYERDRLRTKLPTLLDTRFRRVEFTLKVRSGKDGEIRVFTVNGDEDSVGVDDLISQVGVF